MRAMSQALGKPDRSGATAIRLDPIESKPGYRRVAETIEAEILAGRLKAGDLLPIEADLATQLGVNRSTIREGIRTLENAGLIRRAGGKRLMICTPEQREVTWTVCRALGLGRVTFPELFEILMGLEPYAARLAAGRLRPEAAAAMKENLRLTEEQLYDDEALVALDVEFHRLVAQATGNRALAVSEEPIAMLLHSATDQLYRRSPRARFRLLEAHRHVYEALVARDADGAEQWMRKHIEDFRRGYIVAGMDFKGPIKFGPHGRPPKP
ncbi:MAG: FadR/GntR family transcriptional regulator [Alphaproteobacteria bacterium]